MNDRDAMPTDRVPGADGPAQYQSLPESIDLARQTMRNVKAALTRGADGEFPAGNDDWWYSLNMQPPETAWKDMDQGQRYDLLLHVLDESVWSLDSSGRWDEPRDSQKLALEFVEAEQRQPWPSEIAEANRLNQAALGKSSNNGNAAGHEAGYSM